VGGGVVLTWFSEDAASCQADGAWSGTKAVNGSENIPAAAIGDTFRLTCANGEKSSVSIVTVFTRDVEVTWQAPTVESASSQIEQYKLQYGSESRTYTTTEEIGSTETTRTLSLEPGVYYLTMTSIDTAGEESTRAPEIAFRVQ
jgi:hypothetical protein